MCVFNDEPAHDYVEFAEGMRKSDVPEGVHYLRGIFPPEFLESLDEVMEETPSTSVSNNMYAERRFIRSPGIASAILACLPKELSMSHVLSDMKFIRYPAGGYIAPHVDGVRADDVTHTESTTSFLLYLACIPPGEGGETEILTQVNGGEVICGFRPQRGCLLVFPHSTPHQGAGVGVHPKILLRGDMY
mmetsp:Transcript_9703/g.27731  ORF Transcript_9703/g.27731 Transcript_9703/m.27731 type:complete len:189 (+) Transcript_9703:182-748(+)